VRQSHLPFLMVFDTKGLVDGSAWPKASPAPIVSAQDLNRLKKTNMDFTLCDAAGTSLVCVEFDGLQDGFNVGTSYKAPIPTVQSLSPRRSRSCSSSPSS
jgi:hypothetical protein